MNNHILRNALVTFTSFIFVISVVSAWNAPTIGTVAPANNVSAPVTISASDQEKFGGLTVASLLSTGGIRAFGRVQVGSTTVACAPEVAGSLRWNAGAMEHCNGTAWLPFGGGNIHTENGSKSGFSVAECIGGGGAYTGGYCSGHPKIHITFDTPFDTVPSLIVSANDMSVVGGDGQGATDKVYARGENLTTTGFDLRCGASPLGGAYDGQVIAAECSWLAIQKGGGGGTGGGGDNLGNHIATQNIDMNGSQVTDLGAPVNATDAATKGYVDSKIEYPSFSTYTQNSTQCAGGCSVTATVSCPVGKTLVTGGCSLFGGGPANTFIFGNEPSGNGWACYLWNNSAAANGIKASVVCH